MKDGKNKTGAKAGRRRKSESRAPEIRSRLAAWKQSPEPRISLRVLATELGTSHQLLSSYLRRWDKWQMKEYQRKAKEIRARAETETRPWVITEMLQEAEAYDQAAGRCVCSSVLSEAYKGFEADARRGKLHPKIADLLATVDDPRAQKVLRMSQRKQPEKNKKLDAVLKELDRITDSEKALRLIRQLTPKEREELKALQEKRRRTR